MKKSYIKCHRIVLRSGFSYCMGVFPFFKDALFINLHHLKSYVGKTKTRTLSSLFYKSGERSLVAIAFRLHQKLFIMTLISTLYLAN